MKQKYAYKIKVDGMRCSMCESHVNDLVRRHLDIKRVKSSHLKNETKIVSLHPLDIEEIRKAFDGSGYIVDKIELI